MIKISTSVLSTNERTKAVNKLNNTNNDYLHIDVMDGKFVKNLQFSIQEINELIDISTKPVDIHLMVTDPYEYIKNINMSNKIHNITIHYEIEQNIENLLKYIKQLNIKTGLAIKPNTSINEIKKYLPLIDLLLIMSVEPGYGNQTFIPDTLNKINEFNSLNTNILLEVDGGIKLNNINLLKNNIDIAVVGSYIINSNDYNKAINELKN